MCAHIAVSMRAEVFTFVQRCGSKRLCQLHRHLCVCTPRGCCKVLQQERKTPSLSSCPRPSLGGLGEQDWPEGTPPIPLAWAVPAGLSVEGPTVAACNPPKGCQWVSVPFALTGSEDKQGAISCMSPPQRCPRSRGTKTGGSKALGCAATPAEFRRGAPFISGFHP